MTSKELETLQLSRSIPTPSLFNRVPTFVIYDGRKPTFSNEEGHTFQGRLDMLNKRFGGSEVQPVLMCQDFTIGKNIATKAGKSETRWNEVISDLSSVSQNRTGTIPVAAALFNDARGRKTVRLYSSLNDLDGKQVMDVEGYNKRALEISKETHFHINARPWVKEVQEVQVAPTVTKPAPVVVPASPSVPKTPIVEVTPVTQFREPATNVKGNLTLTDNLLKRVDGMTKDEYLSLNKDNMNDMLKAQTLEGVFKILGQCLGMDVSSVGKGLINIVRDNPPHHHHCQNDDGIGM